jgi:hypothetical protein
MEVALNGANNALLWTKKNIASKPLFQILPGRMSIQVDVLIARVRNFLRTISGTLPGPGSIYRDFTKFEAAKPRICKGLNLKPAELSFPDFTYIVAYYLRASAA